MIFENKKDHIWWFVYDDLKNELISSKKNQLIEPFITVSTGKLFEKIYRESLVLELYWENKINFRVDDKIQETSFKKITFLKLLRKYLSKKLRTIIR